MVGASASGPKKGRVLKAVKWNCERRRVRNSAPLEKVFHFSEPQFPILSKADDNTTFIGSL